MICHKCGRKMDVYDMQLNFSYEGYVGYGSQYDGEYIKLRLCCDCFDELIEGCVVSPEAEEE